MNETQRILHQHDMVLHGNAWHGDPIWQILDGITAECAAARPLADTHSIWEIVLHMTFWDGMAAQRLGGQRAGLDEDEALNFPLPPEPTEANWHKTLEQFRASNQEFRAALEKLDATRVDEPLGSGKALVLRRSPWADPARRLSRRADRVVEERLCGEARGVVCNSAMRVLASELAKFTEGGNHV